MRTWRRRRRRKRREETTRTNKESDDLEDKCLDGHRRGPTTWPSLHHKKMARTTLPPRPVLSRRPSLLSSSSSSSSLSSSMMRIQHRRPRGVDGVIEKMRSRSPRSDASSRTAEMQGSRRRSSPGNITSPRTMLMMVMMMTTSWLR